MDELIVNLWAAYDAETGFVYALSGKVYLVSGDEENKLSILKALARTDHLTAKRYQVPSRFEVIYTDGTVKKNVTSLDAIADPNANLFEEMFENLEADLPPLIFFVIMTSLKSNSVCLKLRSALLRHCTRMRKEISLLSLPMLIVSGSGYKSSYEAGEIFKTPGQISQHLVLIL